MKRIYIFSILFFLTTYNFSQNLEIHRNIQWSDKQDIKHLFDFGHCVRTSSDIAMYSETINLSKYGIYSDNILIKLKNPVYSLVKTKTDYKFPNKLKLRTIVSRGRNTEYLEYFFIPFINIDGQVYKILSFDIEIKKGRKNINETKQTYVSNSVLSKGKWIKIGIVKRGVYKLSYDQLKQLGFSNPQNVRIFGNAEGQLPEKNNIIVPDDLTENYIYKGNNYILFFAEGADKWHYDKNSDFFYYKKNIYTDTAYYFLTDKYTGFSNSVPNEAIPSSSASATISEYTYLYHYEKNLINLLHSGQIWLGESFQYNQTQTFKTNIPNIVIGKEAKIRISIAVRSPLNSSFTIHFDNQTRSQNFGAYYGAHYEQYADYKTLNYTYTQTDQEQDIILIFNKPTPSADAWLDYISLNSKVNLVFNDQTSFRTTENTGAGKISEYEISSAQKGMMIWDISRATRPQNIKYTMTGNTAFFKATSDSIKEYIAFLPSKCPSPIFLSPKESQIANQNIHNVSTNVQMIIISPPEFMNQADKIAKIHIQHDNLQTIVVTTNEIYNEFSSGMKDASAIKNYIRMVYTKTSHKLRYVLLLGDGTYKNFAPTTQYNPNYIPTYQTVNSFNIGNISTTSDDFYAELDASEGSLNGYSDIAIGRFPAKSTDEAEVLVKKLNEYYSADNYGDWRNIITLFTDDRDKPTDVFTTDAEQIANMIDTQIQFLNIKKIYLDAYQQQSSANGEEYPDAVIDLNNRINNGSLIVNYLGHGSEVALTGERVVTIHEVNNWHNKGKLMLMITGTCEFSHFDNAETNQDATSAGEMVILNPNGGAIDMLTTARVSYAGTNLYINNMFYNFLFAQEAGKNLTIGDAYYKAKNTMSSFNKYFFVLLGDPAVILNYPRKKIIATKLNGQNINTFDDTLHALDKVRIQGKITDNNNQLIQNFNGEIDLKFFDKKKNFQTLNNDGNGAMPYWSQYNILFNGRAKVKNGIFNISFIIPKDIYYNFGKSKFSFYAFNSNFDATGYYRKAILGGVNKNPIADNTGPKIRLFMNDSNFVSGGITDPNPSIYAILEDESGINISSAAVGHDISATIDNSPEQTYSLNEYYKSDLNTYKKGIVNYGLYKLKEGNHSVKLKAWDVYNNSSEKSINFIVLKNNELVIKHLLNYPNPFTTHTSFYFEHNQPGVNLDVLLQIFTISGKLVKTIHTIMNTNGYRSDPIEWNGLDDYGNPIGRGVYIYRIKIKTPDNKTIEKYEKLLILK